MKNNANSFVVIIIALSILNIVLGQLVLCGIDQWNSFSKPVPVTFPVEYEGNHPFTTLQFEINGKQFAVRGVVDSGCGITPYYIECNEENVNNFETQYPTIWKRVNSDHFNIFDVGLGAFDNQNWASIFCEDNNFANKTLCYVPVNDADKMSDISYMSCIHIINDHMQLTQNTARCYEEIIYFNGTTGKPHKFNVEETTLTSAQYEEARGEKIRNQLFWREIIPIIQQMVTLIVIGLVSICLFVIFAKDDDVKSDKSVHYGSSDKLNSSDKLDTSDKLDDAEYHSDDSENITPGKHK